MHEHYFRNDKTQPLQNWQKMQLFATTDQHHSKTLVQPQL